MHMPDRAAICRYAETLMPGHAGAASHFTKAGIIPVIPAASMENWRFYVQRPVAKKPELGMPPLQICKGTRMGRISAEWLDMRGDAKEWEETESLLETALREGIEEIGLVLGNINKVAELGGYAFRSATCGAEKQVWLFAATVHDPADFLPDTDVAEYTTERKWVNLEESALLLRPDHLYILHEIVERKPLS